MIKAIETVYNGYKFRSRLEARWAVFFDTLGIEYRYEVEGFEFSHIPPDAEPWGTGHLWQEKTICYLPDFFIPHLDSWVEIKPFYPTEEETYKAACLSYYTDKDVFIFFGEIPYPKNDKYFEGAHKINNGWDSGYMWCECIHCDFFGIEFEGRAARLGCCPYKNSDREHNYDSLKLIAAYTAARQARFEHNHKGEL